MSNKIDLLLIHGFYGDSSGLKKLAKLFPKNDYNIYCPNLPPSHGLRLPKYNTKNYNTFLYDYIAKHNLKNPILIGHSMGSILASNFARLHPNLVHKKVILLAPISHKPNFFFKLLQPLIIFFPNSLNAFLTTLFLSYPKTIKNIKSNLSLSIPSAKQNHSKLGILKSASFSSSHTIFPLSTVNDFLIINGDKECLINNKKTTQQLKSYKNVTLKTIKNTGHVLIFEKPNQVFNEIISFINQD